MFPVARLMSVSCRPADFSTLRTELYSHIHSESGLLHESLCQPLLKLLLTLHQLEEGHSQSAQNLMRTLCTATLHQEPTVFLPNVIHFETSPTL